MSASKDEFSFGEIKKPKVSTGEIYDLRNKDY